MAGGSIQRQALPLALAVAVAATGEGNTAPPDGTLVAVEMEAIRNTLDGCESCGCRIVGELDPGTQREWWISFGLARAHRERAWEPLSASSHCAAGSFEKTSGDFARTVGTPYLVVDLSITPVLEAAGDLRLTTVLRSRKLTRFTNDGQPVYARSARTRMLSVATQGDVTLPLLIPDERETEAFGIDDILLRLRTQALGRGPSASYGVLSVTADAPGAEILLDGGEVARTAEGRPVVLTNVLVGEREIRVRDFSGREARKLVNVEKDRTVTVALEILPRERQETPSGLVPIGTSIQGREEYWRARDRAVVVKVPAGEFLMGSPEGEGERDERPQRRVHLAEFLIDKTEVTWRQLRKFAQAAGMRLPPAPVWGTPDHYSAANIVWEEARAYCAWVGGRLPTEAEWEKAARGADGRRYPWGDRWDPSRCNSISGGPHRPESFGTFSGCLSPYGVLDMAGNMWEWTADWYAEGYYAEAPSRDPQGPASGVSRVLRGGDWISQPLWLRAAYRFKVPPSSRNVNHGFRCAHDALPSR